MRAPGEHLSGTAVARATEVPDAAAGWLHRPGVALLRVTTYERLVTTADTAATLGSGDLPVLATPRLSNRLERAAFTEAAEGLQDGQTTVGTTVKIDHMTATSVGSTISSRCSKPKNDGHLLIFHVKVLGASGEVVAVGEVHRAVVERERFLHRYGSTPDSPAVTD